MQPMPMQPAKSGRSFSKRVRKGVLAMEWISRVQPLSRLHRHAGAACAQVAVIVRAEEDVHHNIAVGNRAEEAAH